MWAYGREAEARLTRLAYQTADEVLNGRALDWEKLNPAEAEVVGEYWNSEDEKEWESVLEMYLATPPSERRDGEEGFLALSLGMMEHRMLLERQLLRGGEQSILWKFLLFRKRRERAFREEHPEAGAFLDAMREQYMTLVRQEDDGLDELIRAVGEINDDEVPPDNYPGAAPDDALNTTSDGSVDRQGGSTDTAYSAVNSGKSR